MIVKREDLANGIVLAVATVLFTVGFFLQPFFVFPFGGVLIAAYTYTFLFLRDFEVGTVRELPADVLRRLVQGLRRAGYLVTEGEEWTTIRVGRYAAVKIRSRHVDDGASVTYRPDATAAGLGWLAVFVLLGWTGVVAIVLPVLFFRRSRSFVREHIVPLLMEAPVPVRPGSPDEVRAMLTEGLAEAARIAHDAYEAEKNRCEDSQAIVVFGAIMSWFLLFVLLPFVLPGDDWMSRLLAAFVLATVGATVPSVFAVWAVRRRFEPRLRPLREWTQRLDAGRAREASGIEPSEGERSTFEVLLEASGEVPAWMRTVRKAGLAQDPAVWGLVFLMLVVGVELVYGFAFWLAAYDLLLGILVGMGGVGLLAGAYVVYRRWTRRRDAEAARTLSDWKRRMDALRARLEGYLERL